MIKCRSSQSLLKDRQKEPQIYQIEKKFLGLPVLGDSYLVNARQDKNHPGFSKATLTALLEARPSHAKDKTNKFALGLNIAASKLMDNLSKTFPNASYMFKDDYYVVANYRDTNHDHEYLLGNKVLNRPGMRTSHGLSHSCFS
ncbi:hypothetical protein Syun_014228 [Stephania yunnanensis]|uniref:Uncharacterized protein n=1 Tax=Stephania yunnanensis TaxID=152371 RepID=A0AAP0JKL7_9MAGN